MTSNVARKLQKAKSLERRGEIAEAIDCYRSVLAAFPANARARNALIRLRQGAAAPGPALREVQEHYAAGRMKTAMARAAELLETAPDSEPLWTLLGAAATALEQHEIARRAFAQAAVISPRSASAHANLGAVLERLGDFAGAYESFSAALTLAPDKAGYLLSRATSLIAVGREEDAIRDIEASIIFRPDHAEAHRMLSLMLRKAGQMQPALAALETALGLDPGNVSLRIELSEACLDADQPEAGIDYLQTALESAPGNARLYLGLGTAYLSLNRVDRAIAHLETASEIDPDCVKTLNNLSSAQFAAGQFEAAKTTSERAIRCDPAHARAYCNLGNVHQHAGQLDLAVENYASAVALDPRLHAAHVQKLHFQAHMCDWQAYEEFAPHAEELGITGEAVPPLATLGLEDHPARQRKRSERFALQWQTTRPVFERPVRRERLRIGYFSGDLYDHATLYLLAGVLERHDRDAFEIFIYGFNKPRNSAQLDRVVLATNQFHDIHTLSDAEIVDRARADKLDIAVDLKGYTLGARPGLFFAGLAPVQINYLGYPGTLGADAFDYIIADEVVLPRHLRDHYAEAVIYMPHSYQPNDDRRVISPLPVTRADCALPENAIVLCCFNGSYKIAPREFDIWMTVMRQIDNTVLWLLDCNDWARDNLRSRAAARGIAAERLVFAEKLPHDRHLARHRLADLFLDTFNLNAHTTASDALYAGLPMVTLPGEQFGARVGASLCHAVGLGDLVAGDAAEYERLIVELSTSPAKLQEVRERLARNLVSAPLFDTGTYTRDLETGYRVAWDKWHRGQAACDVHLREICDALRKAG